MALRKLPVELLEMVAENLSDDKDLFHFALICRETWSAIRSPSSGVWRTQLASNYDLNPGKDPSELMISYQERRKVLRIQDHFASGQSKGEQDCLAIIRELVIESFIDDRRNSSGDRVSKNVSALRYFVRKSDLLQIIFRAPGDTYGATLLLEAVQLLFVPWSLEFSLDYPTWDFPKSQANAYSHPDILPMFGIFRANVNLGLILHISNFFKYHMTSPEEATLFYPFKELAEDQKPRAWEGPIVQGVRAIGRSWKGSYAYLHDANLVQQVRLAGPGSEVFTDSIDCENGFQTLEIDFDIAKITPWPRHFENHLHGLPSNLLASWVQSHPRVSRTRGIDYLLFTGTGMDTEPFHCSGVLHGLVKQQGIPGWQRITMMKYFKPNPSSSWASSPTDPFFNPYTPGWTPWGGDGLGGTDIDMTGGNYWAYEGVVLPGGNMMLGRWWSPIDDPVHRLCVGPFIYWHVPDQALLQS